MEEWIGCIQYRLTFQQMEVQSENKKGLMMVGMLHEGEERQNHNSHKS